MTTVTTSRALYRDAVLASVGHRFERLRLVAMAPLREGVDFATLLEVLP